MLFVPSLTRTFKSVYPWIGIALIATYLLTSNLMPWLRLPFQILHGIEVSGFMLLGTAYKRFLLTSSRNPRTLVSFGVLYIGYFVFAALGLSGKSLGSSMASVIAMFFGVAASVLLSIIIGHSHILQYIGEQSIVFYALNALMLNIAKLVTFRILNINASAFAEPVQWIIGILVTVFAMALMWICDLFIQRWLWWTIGKPKPVKEWV